MTIYWMHIVILLWEYNHYSRQTRNVKKLIRFYRLYTLAHNPLFFIYKFNYHKIQFTLKIKAY